MRKIDKILFSVMMTLMLFSCSEERNKERKFNNLDDFNHPQAIVGVPQGAAAMTVAEERFPNAKIKYFNSMADAYVAVKTKKIDALAFDRQNLEYVVLNNPELAIFPGELGEEHIVVGAPLRNIELIAKVNDFIRRYRADGRCEEMTERWIRSQNAVMPDIPTSQNPKMKLIIGTEGLNEPMNFYGADGKLTGFDIEFIKRLALDLEFEYELMAMNFDGLIPAVSTGRLDLLIANLNATAERKEQMLMSDDYIDSGIVLLVHRDNLPKEDSAEDVFAQFHGQKIASITGTVFDKLIDQVVQEVTHKYFNDYPSMIEALRGGKIYAIGIDHPVGMMIANDVEGITMFPEPVMFDQLGFATRKGDDLAQKASKVIARFRQDGTWEKIAANWLEGAPKLDRVKVEDFAGANYDGSSGSFRFGHDNVSVPMSYVGEGGSSMGFDVELACRIAAELNYQIELVPMQFAAMISSLNAGKVDMIGGCLSITDERKQSVDFTDSYYDGGIMLLVRQSELVDDTPSKYITRLEDLAGKKVGITSGSVFDTILTNRVDSAIPEYYPDFGGQIAALFSGRIAGFIADEPVAILMAESDSRLTVFPENLRDDDYAFVFQKSSELTTQFTRVIGEMKSDGSLEKLIHKWMNGTEADRILNADLPSKGEKGVLKMAVEPTSAPFTYVKNGQVTGFEIELALRICERLGYGLEVLPITFTAFIESVAIGKVDFGGACISVTDERRQSLDFSETHYKGGVALVTLAEPKAQTAQELSFWMSLQRSFGRTFVAENRYKLILQGLWMTIVITLLSAIFGTFLGFGLCMASGSVNSLVSSSAKIFVRVIQGTPIVVLLMILYYVVFGSIDISAVLVAVIGFSINFAAYVSEMMRSGYEAVDKGQLEAASAMGFNSLQVFTKIIFPQAARYVLPVYKGEFISMLKMTSIVGYIAIQDLTKMSDIIRSRTYEAFFPLIVTALIYLVIAYLLAGLLNGIEIQIDPKRRKRRVKGVLES